MERVLIKDIKANIGKEIIIKGWVDTRRDQGKLVFFDFRDMSGKVQCVVLPNHAEAIESAKEVRPEWVLQISGIVNARPERNVQADKQNGDVEIEILNITVLNQAVAPGFAIDTDGKEIDEEVRLEKRYLDLRRERLQENIRARNNVMQLVRNLLNEKNFIEIETPILTKSTPEGARDYIVPSRLDAGAFYALPQSPQQYKQLLMTAGFEKYFQFARCMRDEDTRGDRQPEFTQMDLEMSFATEDDLMSLNEEVLIKVVSELYPDKKIQQIPFPRIPYKEAMEKYGVDRPDLRENKEDPNTLAFCWVVDFPFFEKDKNGKWTFTHNPFSGAKPEFVADLATGTNIENIMAAQYDIVLNGFEIGGGSVRNHNADSLMKVFEILGYPTEKINSDFGHMLEAFRSGTPPHAGLAWGFDRLMMILQNEPNIREVIAFPKTGEGRDLMMQSPSAVSDEQLRELRLKIKGQEENK
jgi:aspartyl-tRNA synthetase